LLASARLGSLGAAGQGAGAGLSMRHLEPLLDQTGVEVRQHSAPLYNSIFRFGPEMLVTPHLNGTPGYAAPLLRLRRIHVDGPFDRFAAHFEALWASSVHVGRD
jgi:hypothetical protein